MRLAFLYVAVILFLISAAAGMLREPGAPWTSRLNSLGLAFFAASFAVPGG